MMISGPAAANPGTGSDNHNVNNNRAVRSVVKRSGFRFWPINMAARASGE